MLNNDSQNQPARPVFARAEPDADYPIAVAFGRRVLYVGERDVQQAILIAKARRRRS